MLTFEEGDVPELSPAKNSSCILEPDDLSTAFPRNCSKQYYRELLAPLGQYASTTDAFITKEDALGQQRWMSMGCMCVRHEMGPTGNHKQDPEVLGLNKALPAI